MYINFAFKTPVNRLGNLFLVLVFGYVKLNRCLSRLLFEIICLMMFD